jgi:5-methylcytosine-specific restriction protein A
VSLSNLFHKFISEYEQKSGEKFKSNEFTKIVTNDIPKLLNKNVQFKEDYIVKGSVGQGNWAETPWVAILNRTVTTSTQNGYYICYLIDPKQKCLYLSLATGWTQFEKDFPLKEARSRIVEYSEYLFKQLTISDSLFRSGPIDLSATRTLSKGYELGQILSKRYGLEDLSDSILLNDVLELIEVHEKLISLIGSDVQNIDYAKIIKNESISQEEIDINKITLENNPSAALSALKQISNSKPPNKKTVFLKKASRNPKIARLIKESQNYICEICHRKPFIQKNSKPYAEADHIVPLGGVMNGLDTPGNMRCLCAQCHAVITHGSDDEISRLLEK